MCYIYYMLSTSDTTVRVSQDTLTNLETYITHKKKNGVRLNKRFLIERFAKGLVKKIT